VQAGGELFVADGEHGEEAQGRRGQVVGVVDEEHRQIAPFAESVEVFLEGEEGVVPSPVRCRCRPGLPPPAGGGCR